MADSGKQFIDLSNQFVALANAMADDSPPELVGEAMLHGATRFMAYLVVREVAAKQGGRTQLLGHVVDTAERMLRHHLAQMAGPEPDLPLGELPGSPDIADLDDPDQRMIAEGYARIGRAFPMVDIVLAAYLRGLGEHEAADSVTVPAVGGAERFEVKTYLSKVYALWQHGLLAEPVAAYVIDQVCMMHIMDNSAEGYVKDPRLDAAAKEDLASLAASYGLQHFATMLRKDVDKHQKICQEGMVTLFGDAATQVAIGFENLRKRSQG